MRKKLVVIAVVMAIVATCAAFWVGVTWLIIPTLPAVAYWAEGGLLLAFYLLLYACVSAGNHWD